MSWHYEGKRDKDLHTDLTSFSSFSDKQVEVEVHFAFNDNVKTIVATVTLQMQGQGPGISWLVEIQQTRVLNSAKRWFLSPRVWSIHYTLESACFKVSAVCGEAESGWLALCLLSHSSVRPLEAKRDVDQLVLKCTTSFRRMDRDPISLWLEEKRGHWLCAGTLTYSSQRTCVCVALLWRV